LKRLLTAGRELEAARLLQRAAAAAGDEVTSARLGYWAGLLLISCGREVEGTLALERAAAALDLLGLPQPALEGLFQQLGLEPDDLAEAQED